jgi:2-polyprenyl-3-methyl-5-hydroxy-6-metoxy-1,4-benzoquinol methylase
MNLARRGAVVRSVKRVAKRALDLYPKWICKREFERQSFARLNERAVEYAFVFRQIGELCPQSVLDVGTGTTALPHLMRSCGCMVTAIDNVRDYWPLGMTNRHYHVVDDDITATKLTDTFDLITCVSVLEHIVRPDEAMTNMCALLKPGGRLVVTFPYTETEYVSNVYRLPGSSYCQNAPFVTQSFSRAELTRWLEEGHCTLVAQEYWQFWEGGCWTVGEQVIPPRRVSAQDKHQLTCVLMRKG